MIHSEFLLSTLLWIASVDSSPFQGVGSLVKRTARLIISIAKDASELLIN